MFDDDFFFVRFCIRRRRRSLLFSLALISANTVSIEREKEKFPSPNESSIDRSGHKISSLFNPFGLDLSPVRWCCNQTYIENSRLKSLIWWIVHTCKIKCSWVKNVGHQQQKCRIENVILITFISVFVLFSEFLDSYVLIETKMFTFFDLVVEFLFLFMFIYNIETCSVSFTDVTRSVAFVLTWYI